MSDGASDGRAGEPQVEDDCLVLGQAFAEHDSLWERRAWLRGVRTGRDALLVDSPMAIGAI